MDQAAAAEFGVRRGERLGADRASHPVGAREIAPTHIADASAEQLFDRSRVAREAAGRQKNVRSHPADTLERRRDRNRAGPPLVGRGFYGWTDGPWPPYIV
jgi:hypothetical protein